MTTPLPLQLQTVAHLILTTLDKPGFSSAAIRRSVSTAYYAVFHHFVSRAVGRLNIGQKPLQRAMRASAARWPAHGRIKSVCEQFAQGKARNTLPDASRGGWPEPSVGLIEAAKAFLWLHAKRHEADYDLATRITREDAESAVQRAAGACLQLEQAVQSDPWAPWFLLLIMADTKQR